MLLPLILDTYRFATPVPAADALRGFRLSLEVTEVLSVHLTLATLDPEKQADC